MSSQQGLSLSDTVFSLFRQSDQEEKTIAKLQRHIATVSTTWRGALRSPWLDHSFR